MRLADNARLAEPVPFKGNQDFQLIALRAKPRRDFRNSGLRDSHTRSLVKAFSWRISGTIATVALVFFLTGKLAVSLEVGALEFASKIVLFYLHERIWSYLR